VTDYMGRRPRHCRPGPLAVSVPRTGGPAQANVIDVVPGNKLPSRVLSLLGQPLIFGRELQVGFPGGLTVASQRHSSARFA